MIELGKRFTRLIITGPANSRDGHTQWMCDCDCGIKNFVAREDKLNDGRVKSCGCLRQDFRDLEKEKADVSKHLKQLMQLMILANKLTQRLALKKLTYMPLDPSNFNHFESSGYPQKVAKEFEEWAVIVKELLELGPPTESIAVVVDIKNSPGGQVAPMGDTPPPIL